MNGSLSSYCEPGLIQYAFDTCRYITKTNYHVTRTSIPFTVQCLWCYSSLLVLLLCTCCTGVGLERIFLSSVSVCVPVRSQIALQAQGRFAVCRTVARSGAAWHLRPFVNVHATLQHAALHLVASCHLDRIQFYHRGKMQCSTVHSHQSNFRLHQHDLVNVCSM